MRHPLVVELNALLRFLLLLPGPIAVQVEQVVVKPATRPRLVVFPGPGGRVGLRRHHPVVPLHVPIAPVGIHTGVENNDRTFQDFLGRSIIFIQQFVHHLHHRLRRNGLVAVDVVAEPGDGRRFGSGGTLQQTDALQIVGTDGFQSGQILG